MITRAVQILKISQAHLAPGMSETRLKAILAAHGINVKGGASEWDKLSDGEVEKMVREIAAIVKGVKDAEITT